MNMGKLSTSLVILSRVSIACIIFLLLAIASDAGDTLTQRLNQHSYPKLYVQIQGWVENSVLAGAVDWDIIVIDAGVADFAPQFLGPNGFFRTTNQSAVILLYHSAADIIPWNLILQRFELGINEDWYMKDIYGNRYPLFPNSTGGWNDMFNLTTQINAYIPNFLNNQLLSPQLADGIFYDWIVENISYLNTRTDGAPCGPLDIDNDGLADSAGKIDSMWVQGTKTLISESRTLFPPNTLIVGNGGWVFDETYANSGLNGRMVEQFLEGEKNGLGSFGWLEVMRGYYLMQKGANEPRVPLLMTNGDRNNYKHMRFGLASTLMFDGYFTYTTPQGWTENLGPYVATWWYDEYSVNLSSGKSVKSREYKGYLGSPISEAYNAQNRNELLKTLIVNSDDAAERKIWRRDFENGTVLVNPAHTAETIQLKGFYKKIGGIYDSNFNDGELLKQINLEPRSGVILLRNRGDIDGNGNLNLADAIFALQICGGMTHSSEINLSGDVNGDNIIGTEEALYILQKISSRR